MGSPLFFADENRNLLIGALSIMRDVQCDHAFFLIQK